MEIVFFAVLAGYLFFRLWGVLGTHSGPEKDSERKNTIFSQPIPTSSMEDAIVSLRKKARRPVLVDADTADQDDTRKDILALQNLDESFDSPVFLRNATSAFTMIIQAYATANHRTLKKLLSPDVYEQFATAIESREKNNLRQETEIEDVHAEIHKVDVKNKKARVTVLFKSQQRVITINEEGHSFDNPARFSVPMTDYWTFEKPIGSDSKSWLLVETRTENA
ncbi:MAG: Tim44/TimA family putative adaptor protein [Alphaproteobacteria bacterium]|nr:Tim44/TimA family putative adaptor protein [Alphaproteobacteria bacterium]